MFSTFSTLLTGSSLTTIMLKLHNLKCVPFSLCQTSKNPIITFFGVTKRQSSLQICDQFLLRHIFRFFEFCKKKSNKYMPNYSIFYIFLSYLIEHTSVSFNFLDFCSDVKDKNYSKINTYFKGKNIHNVLHLLYFSRQTLLFLLTRINAVNNLSSSHMAIITSMNHVLISNFLPISEKI